jgi:choline transport protein
VLNNVVVTWSAVSLVFYCFPYGLPVEALSLNYLAAVLVVMFLYAAVYWKALGRKHYSLPKMSGHNIEREVT